MDTNACVMQHSEGVSGDVQHILDLLPSVKKL